MIWKYIYRHWLLVTIFFLASLAPGSAIYMEKQYTLCIDHQIEDVNAQIAHDRDRIAMLHVEWSTENRPEYLAKLVREHASYLKPSQINQFVSVAGLNKELPQVPRPLFIARAEFKRQLRDQPQMVLAQKAVPTPAPAEPVRTTIHVAQNQPAPQEPHYVRNLRREHPAAITAWRDQKVPLTRQKAGDEEALYVSMSQKKKAKAKTALQTISLFKHNQDAEYN